MSEERITKVLTFEELYNRDIKKYVEKLRKDYKDKSGNKRFFELSYLSWAYGHREMKRIDPDAKEEIVMFPMIANGQRVEGVEVPYLQTPQGFFVKHKVTINERTEEEFLPVLDQSNRPIPNPTSFQINTSNKRCFVKALAKHGLGLYLYVGEDLPENITDDQHQSMKPSAHNATSNQSQRQQAPQLVNQDKKPTFSEWVKIKYAEIREMTGWENEEITVMLEGRKGKALKDLENGEVVAVIQEGIAEIKKSGVVKKVSGGDWID